MYDWMKIPIKSILTTLLCLCTLVLLVGCNANGWMGDPGAQGYYKPTPTTIPILDRIDIIEEHETWPKITKATQADLMPSDLTYRINPGDALDVAIYGLYGSGQFHPVQRRVDQGGYFRVPEVGDVLVAGLTPQGAQDLITKELSEKAMTHPSVQVNVLDQTGFTYTVYGGLAQWGVFTLRDPDMRLMDVIALAGGVPQSIKNIYVIRQLPVSDSVVPDWSRTENVKSENSQKIKNKPESRLQEDNKPSTNIEDLIKQLDIGGSDTPDSTDSQNLPVEDKTTPTPDSDIDELIKQLDIGDDSEAPTISPGVIQTGNHELIDIDDLVPPRHGEQLPVDVDEITGAAPISTEDSAFIYVPESDSWIPVSTGSKKQKKSEDKKADTHKEKSTAILERIIEVPWERLLQGDSSYNIVIRPDDRIYVKPPPLGNLYIRGEIGRPGVFQYPNTGHKITLSEFITSAGDLGPLAVPEKVSLTRRIGPDADMQATVTLNYSGILQRTEPDIFLKPSDHISIGTSWSATPMAIIRSGFRATYGFGFLLDRNFGTDVFGVPP
jgi:protein involved in polysaccharide export with SLBB domain